jgi:hypothetical protein
MYKTFSNVNFEVWHSTIRSSHRQIELSIFTLFIAPLGNKAVVCTASYIVSGLHGKCWLLVRIRGNFSWFCWHGKHAPYQVGLNDLHLHKIVCQFRSNALAYTSLSVAADTYLASRCLAIDYSGFQESCHNNILLLPPGALNTCKPMILKFLHLVSNRSVCQ